MKTDKTMVNSNYDKEDLKLVPPKTYVSDLHKAIKDK